MGGARKKDCLTSSPARKDVTGARCWKRIACPEPLGAMRRREVQTCRRPEFTPAPEPLGAMRRREVQTCRRPQVTPATEIHNASHARGPSSHSRAPTRRCAQGFDVRTISSPLESGSATSGEADAAADASIASSSCGNGEGSLCCMTSAATSEREYSLCNFQKCLPSSSIPSTSPHTAYCRRAGCHSWVTSGQSMVHECSVSFLSVRVRGTFFGLLLGTSKMAMLPKSCNFIPFLNLCAGFSIRKYIPSFGAVGSASASDATAIGITACSYAGRCCYAMVSVHTVPRSSCVPPVHIWAEPECRRKSRRHRPSIVRAVRMPRCRYINCTLALTPKSNGLSYLFSAFFLCFVYSLVLCSSFFRPSQHDAIIPLSFASRTSLPRLFLFLLFRIDE